MLELRLLTHAVSLRASGELAGRLRFLANSAEQEAPLAHSLRYEAVAAEATIELREEGWRFGRVTTADQALLALDERIQARVLDYLARGGRVPVRAGLASVGSNRVMLVAVTPAPLAPLLLQLGLAGAAVEGDAIALVRNARAIAYPRCLRLDAAALAGAPELLARARALPVVVDADGEQRWAVDPRLLAGDWRVAALPVTAVVLVSPAAGPAELVPEPVHLASVALLAARLPEGQAAAAVRETTALLRRAACFSLATADPVAAARALVDRLGGARGPGAARRQNPEHG